MMERLTEREPDGKTYYTDCFKCDYYTFGDECPECDIARKQCRKLAEYEDAEEQGRVIKLPLADGDTVYEISNDYSCIMKEAVSGFAITKQFGTYILLGDCRKPIHTANLGRMVFHTREEAQAKLKEMEAEMDRTGLDNFNSELRKALDEQDRQEKLVELDRQIGQDIRELQEDFKKLQDDLSKEQEIWDESEHS